MLRLCFGKIGLLLGAAVILVGFVLCQASSAKAAEPIKFSDIDKIDLYVTPRALSKAEQGFSTRVFQKGALPGTFEVRPKVDYFKSPLMFSYADGVVRINDGAQRNVQWRFRGLTQTHWQWAFPERSIKINFDRSDDLFFDVLDLNVIETDLFLRDSIAHEVYHAYGMITPRTKLVRLYINGEYAGFRVLLENPDDYFLKERGLPVGNIYREETFAVVGDKLLSGQKYFQRRWVKKSLERQNNWDDWIHFNHVLNLFNRGTAQSLLDVDYYARWMAIGLLLPVHHMIDHNIYMYHNLENQKWYQFPSDMTVSILDDVQENVLYYAPNKLYAIFLRNTKNFYARNREAWRLLNDDSFFKEIDSIVGSVYEYYEKEYRFCREFSKVCDAAAYPDIDWDQIHKYRDMASELLDLKRNVLKKLFNQLPEFSVSAMGDQLFVSGRAPLEFKLKHAGWKIESIEHLSILEQNDQETMFMVEPDPGASHTYRGTRHVSIRDFKISLRRTSKNAAFPQIGSLYGDESVLVMPNIDGSSKEYAGAMEPSAPVAKKNTWADLLRGVIVDFRNREWLSGFSKIYIRLNNREDTQDLFERFILWLDKFRKREYLPSQSEIRWKDEQTLKTTTVVPYGTTLIIEPGTVVKMGRGVSLIVQGTLKIEGKPGQKVLLTSLEPFRSDRDAWGSVCFIRSVSENSGMAYAVVERGSESHEMGVHCKGAVSAYHVPFVVDHSEFRHNRADDALNLLYSRVHVTDSYFHDNKSDALDADFSHVSVERTRFENNGNDGLDLGTAIAQSRHNFYLGQGDKGVSVGEESRLEAREDIFIGNMNGIVLKDGSDALIRNNVFLRNTCAVNAYIKKSRYGVPRMTLEDNYVFDNKNNYCQDAAIVAREVVHGFMPLANDKVLPGVIRDDWTQKRFEDHVQNNSR